MKIREERGITVIEPEEGLIFRRLSDGMIFDGEIWLGYAFQLGDEILKEPLKELPEHYEEIVDDEGDDGYADVEYLDDEYLALSSPE